MADIRLKTITVESSSGGNGSGSGILTIGRGQVFITDSTPSVNSMTGALVLSGGLGIRTTVDSVSSTNGGALTIAGGMSVSKDLYIGKNLTLDNATGEFVVNGITIPRMKIDSATSLNPKITFSPNGINKRVELTNDTLIIDIPTPSTNASTGALCVSGGLAISASEDSTSPTQGGALSVAGGMSIEKRLHVGGGIFSINSNTIGNLITSTNGNVGIALLTSENPNTALTISPHTTGSKINLFSGSDSGTSSLFTGFAVNSNGDLEYHTRTTNGSHVFYSEGSRELFRINGDGNIGIRTSTPSNTLDVNGGINYITTLNSNGNVINNFYTNGSYGTRFTVDSNVVLKRLRTSRGNASDCVSKWYVRHSVPSLVLRSSVWSPELSLYVAVGGNRVYYSNNSIDWISITLNDATVDLRSVCWSSELGLFVAVGTNTAGNSRIFRSGNAISWIPVVYETNQILNSVCWSSELGIFVAVGNNGTKLFSQNGSTWQVFLPSTPLTTNLNHVIWASEANKFIIVGNNGVIVSIRGMGTIVRQTSVSNLSNNWTSLTWSPELGLFLTIGGTRVAWSKNGEDWESQNVIAMPNQLIEVEWSADLSIFLTIDTSGKIFYSNDGRGWFSIHQISNVPSGIIEGVITWSSTLSLFVLYYTRSDGTCLITTSDLGIPNRKSVLLTNPAHMMIDFSTGNVGIGTTAPNYRLHVAGDMFATGISTNNLHVTNSVFVNKIQANIFTGANLTLTGTLSAGNVVTNFISGGNVYLSGGITTANIQSQRISSGQLALSGDIVCGGKISGSILNAKGMVHTIGNLYIVNDKVGINTSSPSVELDIVGGLQVSDTMLVMSSQPSNNSTTGGLVVLGGLAVNSSVEATSTTSGGGLTVAGGVGIGKSLYVGGSINILDTTNSSVSVGGGMHIGSTEEANGLGTSSGALRVDGGVDIAKNLHVGGTIYNNSPIYARGVTISGTEPASSFDTGSVIINGGVSIASSQNATSLVQGGALLVKGGTSLGGDLYVGGKTFIYNGSQYYSNDPITIADQVSHNARYTFKINEVGDFNFGRHNTNGGLIENVYTISNSDGSVSFNNTSANVSISISGKVAITDDSQSLVANVNGTLIPSGGALHVGGGLSMAKNANIGGEMRILSTTQSITTDTGSLVVAGGMGIAKNLNVGGNLSINGDLYVNGQTTYINSVNTIFRDNMFVLNSAPVESSNSGMLIKRFQLPNDDGFGEVVRDTDFLTGTLSAQTVDATQIQLQLPNGFPNADVPNYYTHWWIKVIDNIIGKQRVRKIISYNSTLRVATVDLPWGAGYVPSDNEVFFLYNKSFIGTIYNETTDRFEIGSALTTLGNALNLNVPVACYKTYVEADTPSSNSTTGSLLLKGGISIENTTDATSATVGGTITTLGGVGVAKSLFVGKRLIVNNVDISPHPSDQYTSFTFGALNATTDIIPGFTLHTSTWGFDGYLYAELTLQDVATSELGLSTSYYHLRGVNKSNGIWELAKTYVGDNLRIDFNIDSNNTLTYTTPDYEDEFDNTFSFVSLKFKWRRFAV